MANTFMDNIMLPVVKSLINEMFGKSVTYTKVTSGTYNPNTRAFSGATVTDYTVKIIPPSDFSERSTKRGATLDTPTTIISNDMKTGLPKQNLAFTPEINDQMTIDSVEYVVTEVDSIYSGNQICLFILTIKMT